MAKTCCDVCNTFITIFSGINNNFKRQTYIIMRNKIKVTSTCVSFDGGLL